MKKNILICFCLILAFNFGCENTDIIETNIEYEEFIVVQADLIRGIGFAGVSITKTLPLNQPYNENESIIKDADAYIKINGKQIVPLHYNQDGTYKPLYKLIPTAGSVYELYAKINEKSIYSITTVPANPQPISSIIRYNQRIEIQVKQHSNEVYGALWIIKSGTSIIAESSDFEVIESNTINDLPVTIITQDFDKEYTGVQFFDNMYYRIISFDKPYRDYFKTRVNNAPIKNSLLNGGGSVIWNVYGDNVIGLFIGSCIGDIHKVN